MTKMLKRSTFQNFEKKEKTMKEEIDCENCINCYFSERINDNEMLFENDIEMFVMDDVCNHSIEVVCPKPIRAFHFVDLED